MERSQPAAQFEHRESDRKRTQRRQVSISDELEELMSDEEQIRPPALDLQAKISE